jgi:hypothetical protein
MGEIGNADCIDRHVGVAIDLRVDRHEVVVAVVLNPTAGKVDKSLHIGAGRRRFFKKIAKGRPQGLAIEVARADHVEARRLQSLGDKPGVVGGSRERHVAIGRVADDESDAGVWRRLLSLRGGREKARGQNHNSSENRLQA